MIRRTFTELQYEHCIPMAVTCELAICGMVGLEDRK
jgi:hypothetical protein